MAVSGSGNAELVQRLFERQLGPPKPLPEPEAASQSSSGADFREKERVSFKVARGAALDYQVVPATGTLLGVTYQPQRDPPRRQPRPQQLAAANGVTAYEGAEAAPSATAATPAAALRPLLKPQPAHATLWALLQPTQGVGLNTSISAVDGGMTGFGGWHQSGFVDLSRRAGIDFNLARHPASGITGEVEVQATMPKLPLLPAVTAQHRVSGAQAGVGLQHSSSLSAPLPGGVATARVRVAEAPGGPDGTLVTFELQGRSRRSSRGLAGGAKLLSGLSCAFRGGSKGEDIRNSSDGGVCSDSDEDSSGGCSSSRKDLEHARRRVPGLRLQMVPATAASWEDVSGHWRQAWGSRVNTTIGYQGQQRRWNVELNSRLTSCLTAAGSLVGDGPADAAAVWAEAEAAAGAGGGGRLAHHAQQVQRHVGAYLGASRLCRAAVKLSCRLRRPVRQQLHVETSMGEDGSLAHSVRFRLGGRADYRQQRARCDLSLTAQPRRQDLFLKFDIFTPL